jgi:diguanylate cyclase (GGDEF)-like protein
MAGSDMGHSLAVRLMQHLVVPTFVLDADRRVTIWNHACERLTGIPAADMIGTRDHWRAFYNESRPCLADLVALDQPERLEELFTAHAKPSEFGHGLRAENWCTMPMIGQRRYLAVDAGPIFDDHGKLIAIVETLRDMTEQKLAELALQNLAHKDGLTGVANRRSLDEKLALEWKCSRRSSQPLSVLLCDVDDFKRYNDTYGHPRGDDCLRSIAGAISATVFRPADLVGRYGGEEFAIIMPDTDLVGAQAVGHRLCEAVRELQLPHEHSALRFVTISVGVASCVATATEFPESLVSAADAALYQAKHAGRNRVSVSTATHAWSLSAAV